YERGKRIGQGGFGTVYFGIRRKAGSQDSQVVAIKSVTGKFAITALDEQAIMIRAEGHRNFLQFFDCGTFVIPILIMEYFDGRDLRDWVEFYTSFTPSLVKHIAREALSGLAYLHEGTTPGFIHRDISMGNILMSADFKVKIIDYGCAIPVSPHNSVRTVETLMQLLDPEFNYGIPFFRAPEILEERLWTTAADIWALGMVLLFTTRANSHVLTNESGVRSISSLQTLSYLTDTKSSMK
ncbi:kinase-like protein, partial [Cylindrobasidium torrendii FP15055 ss-10]